MGCRAQPVRYPISRTVQQMTRETRMGQPSYTEFRILPAGRLMRENGIKIIRTQKYKATTDSNHTFNIAPNLLDRDFYADAPNQKWAGDISYIWTREGWLYLAVSSTCIPAALLVGPRAIG